MTPTLGVECALPKDFRPYESRARRFRWLLLAMALAGVIMI